MSSVNTGFIRMKERNHDSKEQIVKAFDDLPPCEICGYREDIHVYRSRITGKELNVCFCCHRKEIINEKKMLKEIMKKK